MTNTPTTLTGLFKEVYAPSLKFLMPKNLRFQTDISFVPAESQPGGYYNQPVVLKHEHGFTYKGPNTDAYDLVGAIAGQIKNAQVLGSQITLASVLGVESASRASSGGKRAFVQATKYLVENMWQSMRKRVEIELLYGQIGLATIASVAGDVMTITPAEWAPGLWAGMEGAHIEVFTSTLGAQRTGTGIITAVSIEDRTVTTASTLPASTAATDIIFFYGQVTAGGTPAFATPAGIHKILANTGSLFGIDAAAYSLWKSNVYAVGSVNLSFEAIQRLIARCVGKGCDGDLVLYCNPLTWATLLSDQAALRRHGDPNKSNKYTLGSENIEFFSQIGRITIKASIYVKEGYAYLISPAKWHRIGATDITFSLPDRGDEFFFHLETKTGYGLRCYTNQAIFCEAPGQAGYLSGIDNT